MTPTELLDALATAERETEAARALARAAATASRNALHARTAADLARRDYAAEHGHAALAQLLKEHHQ